MAENTDGPLDAGQPAISRMAEYLTKIAQRDGEKGEKLRRAIAGAMETMKPQTAAAEGLA